jgi:uncharacterized protein
MIRKSGTRSVRCTVRAPAFRAVSACIAACMITGTALFAGCGKGSSFEHRDEIEAWHAARLNRLQAEDGWLTLIGLFPLPHGEHTLGTGPDSDLRIEAVAPPYMGTLIVRADGVRFVCADDVQVGIAGRPQVAPRHDDPASPAVLQTDRDGAPTVLQIGSVSFHIIERGEALFLRVRDADSAVRQNFEGIERFPVDASWRVTACLKTRDAPPTVPIVDVLGRTEQRPTPGLLVFEHRGTTHSLIPIGESGGPLFIIFKDQTTGASTYGGGRYLYADAPGPDGCVILDFNLAYNPPCSFTPYATCPMPPSQNMIEAHVTAGEKTWRPAF